MNNFEKQLRVKDSKKKYPFVVFSKGSWEAGVFLFYLLVFAKHIKERCYVVISVMMYNMVIATVFISSEKPFK